MNEFYRVRTILPEGSNDIEEVGLFFIENVIGRLRRHTAASEFGRWSRSVGKPDIEREQVISR